MMTDVDISSESPLIGSSGMTNIELQAHGQALGDEIMHQMYLAQSGSARSQQSASRVLGMSELGGCREYIRASVSGDEKTPERGLRWAAFVGTALGDYMEHTLASRPGSKAILQERLTLTLSSGITVTGSGDVINPVPLVQYDNTIVDFKSKDGLATIRREGFTSKEKIQISGYVVAAVQNGVISAEGAIGLLMGVDRSGKDKTSHTWTVDYAGALRWLEIAERRLDEVAEAMATGVTQGYLRDEPESRCWHLQCPFYKACWPEGVYQPVEPVESDFVVEQVELYKIGRKDAKVAADIQNAAKSELMGFQPVDPEHPPVSGVMPDGTTLNWILKNGRNDSYWQIDVREARAE